MSAIAGKVALVTGGAGPGCGRAISRRFAREGAHVVVSDIDEAGGAETVQSIQADDGRACFCHADVSREQEARELISFAEQRFGRIDYLVNNASALVHPDGPLEHWRETVETDLLGAMYSIRAAIDAMRRGGGGAIVNMTSISALPHGRSHPAPGYDAAKAGLLHLTTTLAPLALSDNIRVNCLAPGWIGSPQVREFWEQMTAAQRAARGAPGRLLTVDEVAGAVLRLATDESLAGRVMVWHSEREPVLIAADDPGYAKTEAVRL